MQFETLGFKYDEQKLFIVDQTQLPFKEVWLDATQPDQLIKYIQQLSVRGAPLIGIVAGLCLGILAEKSNNWEKIKTVASALRQARPTAVNLMNIIDELIALNDPERLLPRAIELAQKDADMCERMGVLGASLINNDEHIIHYCNTGQLATAGIGTALGVLHTAHKAGKNIHVYVCETRPLLQGARLTAWELDKIECPYTLICDNMAASLMQAGKVDRCMVGADRVAMNGDFANKIGTYNLAVLAHFHQVDFHAVAPLSTLDAHCPSGDHIPIELRNGLEILSRNGHQWALENTPTHNPAFDVTPAGLYTSLVLDQGIIPTKDIIPGTLETLINSPA